jgi:transitional endoplasmic reticulum ATPase
MSQTLQQLAKKAAQTVVADVIRLGEKITIPDGMTGEEAILSIKRMIDYENKETMMTDTFDVFPWDGAVSLHRVLTAKYGFAEGVAVPGTWFSPEEPPEMHNIEVDYNRKELIPWGRLAVPGVEGYLETQVAKQGGRYVFKLAATVKRRDESIIQEIFTLLKAEVKRSSIYRGKAIKIRFKTESGETQKMPEPKFLNANAVDESMLVFSQDIMNSVRTNLFTPIQRATDCIANGISIKRGILLGGLYGTGKTLAAAVASKYAVQSGVTYIYVPRADELKDAIEFAKQYQSPAAVVFCEDVDRVITGDRSVAMDDILNTIDGIDSKNSHILVVLTTNHLEMINPAMLRPGRLDAVIEVLPPDAEAVQRLIRNYAGSALPPDENLTGVGETLKGQIPAIIAEVVKRAKLAQLAIQAPGTKVNTLSAKALADAAYTMASQIKLLNDMIDRGKEKPPVALEEALKGVVKHAMNGHFESFNNTQRRIKLDTESRVKLD